MNRKGFTLVETLGVLIVITFLGFLISNTLVNNISKTKGELEKVANDLIISAAREYVFKYPDKFPKEVNASYYVDYSTLKDDNLINDQMLPEMDKIEELKSKKVKVIYDGNKYIYTLINSN